MRTVASCRTNFVRRTAGRRRSARLDPGRSVPATARTSGSRSCAVAVDDPETNDRRRKEEDSSQEGESDISLELGALRLPGNTVPVPDAAAVHGADVL